MEKNLKVEDLLKLDPNHKRQGKGYLMRCPAHDDSEASLSVSKGHTKDLIVHCHAGCSHRDIIQAASNLLGNNSIIPPSETTNSKSRKSHKNTGFGDLVATYRYTDDNGKLAYLKRKYVKKIGDKTKKDFFFLRLLPNDELAWGMGAGTYHRLAHGEWSSNDKHANTGKQELSLPYEQQQYPYNLPNLIGAQKIIFVEGEKDADTANAQDGSIVATSFKGWTENFNKYIDAGAQCYAVGDMDDAGREQLQNFLDAVNFPVTVCEMPNASEGDDLTDWVNKGGSIEKLKPTYIHQATRINVESLLPKLKPIKQEFEYSNDLEHKIHEYCLRTSNILAYIENPRAKVKERFLALTQEKKVSRKEICAIEREAIAYARKNRIENIQEILHLTKQKYRRLIETLGDTEAKEESFNAVLEQAHKIPEIPKCSINELEQAISNVLEWLKEYESSRKELAKQLIGIYPESYGNHLHIPLENDLIQWRKMRIEADLKGSKIIATNALHGMGKTESMMPEMIKDERLVLIVTNRRSLGQDISNRLKLCGIKVKNYQDRDMQEIAKFHEMNQHTFANDPVKVIVVSIQSLHKFSFLDPSLVIVDEFEQVLKDVTGDTVKNSEATLNQFKKFLTQTNRVVLSDAGANRFALEAYAKLASTTLEDVLLCTVETPKCKKKMILELTLNPATNRKRMLGFAKDAYQRNEKAYLFSESLTQAEANRTDLEEAGAKCLAIFGDNALNDEDKKTKHAFIANVNEQIQKQKPDIVLSNSSALAGLSINDSKRYFKRWFGAVSGTFLSGTDVLQAPNRVRYLNEFYLIALISKSGFAARYLDTFEGFEIETASKLKDSIQLYEQWHKWLFMPVLMLGLERGGFEVNIITTSKLSEDKTTSKAVRQAKAFKILQAERITKQLYSPRNEAENMSNKLFEIETICGKSLDNSEYNIEMLADFLGSKGEQMRAKAIIEGRYQFLSDNLQELARSTQNLFKKALRKKSELLNNSKQAKDFLLEIADNREALRDLNLLPDFYKREIPLKRLPLKVVNTLFKYWGLIDKKDIVKKKNSPSKQQQILEALTPYFGTGASINKIHQETGLNKNTIRKFKNDITMTRVQKQTKLHELNISKCSFSEKCTPPETDSVNDSTRIDKAYTNEILEKIAAEEKRFMFLIDEFNQLNQEADRLKIYQSVASNAGRKRGILNALFDLHENGF